MRLVVVVVVLWWLFPVRIDRSLVKFPVLSRPMEEKRNRDYLQNMID